MMWFLLLLLLAVPSTGQEAEASNCKPGNACQSGVESGGSSLLQMNWGSLRSKVDVDEDEDEDDAEDNDDGEDDALLQEGGGPSPPPPTCETMCDMNKLGTTPSACLKAKAEADCGNAYYKRGTKATFCKWKPSGKCQGGSFSLTDCDACETSGAAAVAGPAAAPANSIAIPTTNTIANSNRTGSAECATVDIKISFTKFRFRTTSTRTPKSKGVHLAEIEFQDASGNTLTPNKMANIGGKNPKTKDPSKANDGKTNSQWFDGAKEPLLAIFNKNAQPAKFRFTTASDDSDSDPLQWVLEARQDSGTWLPLHEQTTDFDTPKKRQQTTEWLPLQASYIGQECYYECDDGYVEWGRHVYQHYDTQGVEIVAKGFQGGHCEPLCAGNTGCANGEFPIRYREDDNNGGFCLATECFDSKDTVLKKLARGNYEMWNLARNTQTGLYVDSMQVLKPDATWWNNGNTGMAGIGMIVECIGHAMKFVDTGDAQKRVLLTLNSLAGNTKGVKIPRKDLGMFSGLLNTNDGSVGTGPGQLGNNGFLMSGVLFQKTYWKKQAPNSKLTKKIVALADELFNSVEWAKILCTNGKLDPKGSGLPFLVQSGGICQNVHTPAKGNGLYEVDELYIAVWLMYYHTCGDQPEGQCSNKAIEKLWQGHQGRRLKPDHEIFGEPIVLDWGSYTVQLNYYLSGAFNADPKWHELFVNQYNDEKRFYMGDLYYGDDLHYGLAAGPTMKKCAGTAYIADRLWDEHEKPTWSPNCRTWSPYAVAGYMPVDPDHISQQLAGMLETGEAVTTFTDAGGKQRFILNRRSLLYVDFEPYQTMVDISEEMFGLGYYFLGGTWWNENTDYFGVLSSSR